MRVTQCFLGDVPQVVSQLLPPYSDRSMACLAERAGDVAALEAHTKTVAARGAPEGVGGVASMMQADGIHPAASAQSRLLDNVWPTLKPML